MMDYPTAQDYVLAVQNPQSAFRDPHLREARFPVDPILGVPFPASGNAAVVFKAAVDRTDQALRFFIREDVSNRDRYALLHDFLQVSPLRGSAANPVWIDDAIIVNGGRWPMVRMEWVNGRTLDRHVADLAEAGDRGGLAGLAHEWRDLIGTMQRAGFAHGDLQHGNVLVEAPGPALRLVDFDGSWIPDLAGRGRPTETGHRNYQRSGREWGRWMDTFPGLVVYTGLLALAADPGRWDRFSNGENIVFVDRDFTDLDRPVWSHLLNTDDKDLTWAATHLQACCRAAEPALGPLEELLASTPPAPISGPGPARIYRPPPRPSRPTWWEVPDRESFQWRDPDGAATHGAAAAPPPPRANPQPAPRAGSGSGVGGDLARALASAGVAAVIAFLAIGATIGMRKMDDEGPITVVILIALVVGGIVLGLLRRRRRP